MGIAKNSILKLEDIKEELKLIEGPRRTLGKGQGNSSANIGSTMQYYFNKAFFYRSKVMLGVL